MDTMQTLDELAIKFNSDKSSLSHNYTPFYEQHLPKNPKKLLEIGVLKGSSIKMWREYFPDTIIHALDLFEENPIPDIPGVVFHKGNQLDYKILEQLRNEDFDVIVEDCSHNSRDQMMTFFGLFNGKQYYIEDIHCADEEFYRQGLPLPLTAKFIFDQYSGHYKAVYDCQSPIVLIQNV
jgi:hypothetical protein